MWPTLLPRYRASAGIGRLDPQGGFRLLLGKVELAFFQGPDGNDLAGGQIVRGGLPARP